MSADDYRRGLGLQPGYRVYGLILHGCAQEYPLTMLHDALAAWKPVKYRNALWDADEGRRVSEAEIAEIGYTAFTSKKTDLHATGRLIVRRVKRLNPATVPEGRPDGQPANTPARQPDPTGKRSENQHPGISPVDPG